MYKPQFGEKKLCTSFTRCGQNSTKFTEGLQITGWIALFSKENLALEINGIIL
jgi:hypothetical protein